MLNIWHIFHTKHKKQLPSDVVYVPKLYYLCLYRCKFATVQTDVVNQNDVFYLAFSLLSLLVLIFSLSSHIRPSSSLNRERTKCHTPHLHGRGHSDRIIAIVIAIGGASAMGEATPIIAIVIAALISLISLSLSLFWWLVVLIVGGLLILVDGGRLIGLWV